MSNRTNRILTRAAAAATLALSLGAAAPVMAQTGSDWRYHAIIYGYFPSISGDTKFPAVAGGASVNVSASQILDALKFTFMGTFEANNGRWGVFGDILYVDLSTSKSNTRDINVPGGIPADVTSNLTLDLKTTMGTMAGTYRIYARPDAVVDVLAGARVVSVKPTLDFEFNGNLGGVQVPGRQGQLSGKVTDWDGIVGIKGRSAFGANREWFIPYYLDAGAGDSEFTWQGIVGLGYSFKWGEVIAAWRYVDYQFKSDAVFQDLTLNGPAIGVAFRW